ncbi:MAG: hypothetical protein J6O13_17215 [Selenomonas sp.]|nr:hypothetical protein [Selenomonas sp.]
MINVKEIADKADMIVSGYAFTRENEKIRVLNLDCPPKALVLDKEGQMLETNMDDIEMEIVMDIYRRNKKYMEDSLYA